jgi:hypothetical protein
MDRVLGRLNRKVLGIKGASMKGLVLCAMQIRYDMDKTPPLIPMDTGNLRSSWFVEVYPSRQYVECGFSAKYAPFVHEMIGATFKRSGAGPKFFQASVRRNMPRCLEIIRRTAQIR